MVERMFHKGSTTGEKALTPGQVDKLLSVITNLEELTLIKIAIAGGLRRKDVVNIRRKDVNSEEHSLTFFEHKKNRTYKVYLSEDVMNTIAMWIRMSNGSQWLFPSHYQGIKRHLCSKTAYNYLNRLLKKAGLPQRPFHALRATCIKLCQSKGWSAEQTAKHVGDTIRTIQQHYSTPSAEEMKKIAEENSLL